MKVSYKRLWKLLIDKDMNRQDLMKATGISPASIAKLGKGLPVHLNTLLKICSVLHCSLDDIVDVSASIPERSFRIR